MNARQEHKRDMRIEKRKWPAFIVNANQIDIETFAKLKPGQVMYGYDCPTVTRVRLK